MIDKVSKILGIVAFLLSTIVLAAYLGFGYGSNLCGVKYPIIGGAWWSDLDPYITYFNRQRFITLFILIFLIGKAFKNKWITHSVCLLSLIFPIYSILETIYYKNKFWDEADNYLMLGRYMFNYELMLAVVILTLLVLEIILIIRNSQGKIDKIL